MAASVLPHVSLTLTLPQYMVILGLVFLFQLGVSCSCLALNTSREVSQPPCPTLGHSGFSEMRWRVRTSVFTGKQEGALAAALWLPTNGFKGVW